MVKMRIADEKCIIIVIDFYNLQSFIIFVIVLDPIDFSLWPCNLTLESSHPYKNWNISWFEVGKYLAQSWSMFGGAYGDARMPNWPHWHRTPLPGIATTGLLTRFHKNVWNYVYVISQKFLKNFLQISNISLKFPASNLKFVFQNSSNVRIFPKIFKIYLPQIITLQFLQIIPKIFLNDFMFLG